MKPVVQNLLTFTGHSLRRLDLTDGDYDIGFTRAGGHFVGSLKAFRVLETIRARDLMFIKWVKTDDELSTDSETKLARPRKLIDMLSASLLCIIHNDELRCTYILGHDVAIAVLQNLPERKVEILPNLETVEFEYSVARGKGGVLALLRAGKEAGVEINSQDNMLD